MATLQSSVPIPQGVAPVISDEPPWFTDAPPPRKGEPDVAVCWTGALTFETIVLPPE